MTLRKKDLKVGRIIYKVTTRAKGIPAIRKVKILTAPYQMDDVGLFINILDNERSWDDRLALCDYNVKGFENTYKKHRVFFSKRQATVYLRRVSQR